MKIVPLLATVALAASLTACAGADKAASDTSATEAVAEQAAAEEPAGDAVEVPTEEPEPSEPAQDVTDMPVGQTITVENGEFELQVQAVSTTTSATPPDEYTEPPVNGLWMGVLIQYNCVTGSCDYNPYDFVLRGPDGAEYDTAFVYDDPTFEPELNSGTLNAGVPAKGYVVYDVKPGSYSLEYRSSLWDEQAASWTVTAA